MGVSVWSRGSHPLTLASRSPSPLLELVEGVAQPERAQHDQEAEHGSIPARVLVGIDAHWGQLRRAAQEAGVEGSVEAGVETGAEAQQAHQGTAIYVVVPMGVAIVVLLEDCGYRPKASANWVLGDCGEAGLLHKPGSHRLAHPPSTPTTCPCSSALSLLAHQAWPSASGSYLGQPCHPPAQGCCSPECPEPGNHLSLHAA